MRVLRVRNDYMTTRKYVIKLKHDLQGLAAVAEQAPEYLVGAAEQASENPLFCGVETDSFSLNVTKQNIMAYTCELAGADTETLSPRQLMIRLVRIGEKYIRSELTIIPAKLSVIDYYTATYKCAHCEQETGESYIEQAKAPVPVMKKSMAAASTVAYVMQEKFQKGVPLYRQEEYWKSQGVDLRRNTMANWVIRSSRWFAPLWDAFRDELLQSGIVNADETDCHVLKEDGRESKQMSKMWVFCSPEKNIALYQYKPSRKGQVAKEMLKGFSGYLQTDGYSGYNAVENVTHIGCWAHARRKWVDCFVDNKPVEGSKSQKAFEYVEKIFALDSSWKDLPPDDRKSHRLAELKPVMDEYWEFLNSFESDKNSNLGKAQTYSLNQREALESVLLDGRLTLTNNLAERTVKPFVMSRRNFLFCDTSKGADASALCFSMIETAKRNGLDPFGYLLFLLQELPKLGEMPAMSCWGCCCAAGCWGCWLEMKLGFGLL